MKISVFLPFLPLLLEDLLTPQLQADPGGHLLPEIKVYTSVYHDVAAHVSLW